MTRCNNCPFTLDHCPNHLISHKVISKNSLDNLIKESLKDLYLNDIYLIKHKVYEVSIVVQFLSYFKKRMKDYCSFYDIDMEYSKNGDNPKLIFKTDKGKANARPDLIVHKRGCNKSNLIYMEFKGYWNDEYENDYKKIKAFTNPNHIINDNERVVSYKYSHGLFIKLYENFVELTWFSNGKQVAKTEIFKI